MSIEVVAELSAVTKRYGPITALDGLDLQVGEGEMLALLGPNGAGKTTAISLWLGLERPDSGTASLFGRSPRDLAARRRIGVMMQEVFLAPELKVREHLDLVSSCYPAPMSPREALERTHTAALGEMPYGKLSGGQKRQAQFAAAICGRPRLLFLDEPTAGLDPQARQAMWTTLRGLVRDGSSIVLTTHYLEEAESLADRVAVVNKGRPIATGTVSAVRALIVRKHVYCATRLSPAEVAAWPGVATVSVERHRLHITADDAEAVVRRLLAADETLQELEVRRAGLAEAFTELTKEAA